MEDGVSETLWTIAEAVAWFAVVAYHVWAYHHEVRERRRLARETAAIRDELRKGARP